LGCPAVLDHPGDPDDRSESGHTMIVYVWYFLLGALVDTVLIGFVDYYKKKIKNN
jgi:hypothetical protein